MTETTMPHIPYRFERTIEVPAGIDDVWHAIATGDGITSWMLPTEVEERPGGRLHLTVNPTGGLDSFGVVKRWDRPTYFVYDECWATLSGQDQSKVTPLVNEFFAEQNPDGTCAVRVVSSAFGQGDAWERTFFDVGMERGWAPLFEHLRLYLTHFADQRGAMMIDNFARFDGRPAQAIEHIRRAAHIDALGQRIKLLGVAGTVEILTDEHVVVVLDDPVPGLLCFHAYAYEPSWSHLRMVGHLYSKGAAAYVDNEGEAWGRWLESAVPGPAAS